MSLAQAQQSTAGATPVATASVAAPAPAAAQPRAKSTVTMNPSDAASQEQAFRSLDTDNNGLVSKQDTVQFLMDSLSISEATMEEVCRMLNPEGKDFNIGGFRQAVLLATVTKSKIPSTQEEAPQSAGGAAGGVSEGDVWHPISDEEHITYQQSFEWFDTDRDGKLSAGDVKQVCMCCSYSRLSCA